MNKIYINDNKDGKRLYFSIIDEDRVIGTDDKKIIYFRRKNYD